MLEPAWHFTSGRHWPPHPQQAWQILYRQWVISTWWAKFVEIPDFFCLRSLQTTSWQGANASLSSYTDSGSCEQLDLKFHSDSWDESVLLCDDAGACPVSGWERLLWAQISPTPIPQKAQAGLWPPPILLSLIDIFSVRLLPFWAVWKSPRTDSAIF